MKKAIFSGTLDPIHNGHVWAIQQAMNLFDEVHVALGSPPKDIKISSQDRLTLTKESLPKDVHCSLLEGTVIDMAAELQGDVTVIRSMRDAKDFQMEQAILRHLRAQDHDIKTTFFVSPDYLVNLSSTYVWHKCKLEDWNAVSEMVPYPVLAYLKKMFGVSNWLVYTPDVKSIFETATAGFAPSPRDSYEPVDKIEPVREIRLVDKLEKTKDFFHALIDNRFFSVNNMVPASSVRNMLDPFPYDIVTSDKFYLKTIHVNDVVPIGKRYLSCSQSLGPIIVEANEVLGDTSFVGPLGPVIIIEGKHRWFDAKDKGDKRILAWVGEKALPLLFK